jgi:sugar lactone lactonase YvrE
MVSMREDGILPTATLAFDSRCTLGESITWCARERVLWWTDISGRRIWRGNPDTGSAQWWSTPGRVGSLALCESGRLLLGMEKALYFADPPRDEPGAGLSCERVCEVPMEGAALRINDGRLDRSGNFVFGCINEDPARARIARFNQYSLAHGLRPLALEPVAIANGICFDPDGSDMYYCDSLQGRIMHARYDAAAATVGDPRVFAVIEGGAEPDGAVVDADGRVWGAQWGAGQVVRYSAAGEVELRVPVPASQPTCVAFAGEHLGTLYVTSARDGLDAAALHAQPASGGVFRAMLEGVRGLPDVRFADA